MVALVVTTVTWPTFAPRFPICFLAGNRMTMSKNHRSVTLYQEKNLLRMRAPASSGNHFVAAVDAQGHKSSSTDMADTTMAQLPWWNVLTIKDVIGSRRAQSKQCALRAYLVLTQSGCAEKAESDPTDDRQQGPCHSSRGVSICC